MKVRLVALLLLSFLGSGLFLGPHPCHAGSRETAPAEPKGSCHGEGMEARGGSAAAEDDGPADGSGCCRHRSRCEMACHSAIGILANEDASPLSLPFERLVLPPAQRSLRLFSPSIDHVPLA
jgi:hypothetical protein